MKINIELDSEIITDFMHACMVQSMNPSEQGFGQLFASAMTVAKTVADLSVEDLDKHFKEQDNAKMEIVVEDIIKRSRN